MSLAVIAWPQTSFAGPPFLTDDPEPVAFGHWEFYLASAASFTSTGGSGTLPHIEINYGAVPDVQLHVLAPLAFDEDRNGFEYGPGDVELGAKLRFVHESTWLPQVGVFPLIEVPAGAAERGLGAGATQLFAPVWIQKSFGPWTTYGGGGRWFTLSKNPTGWWFFGWMLQRQLSRHLTLGAEAFYESATIDSPWELAFNVGAIVDLTEHHHILVSAGRAIVGEVVFQDYLAYQLTF